MKTFTRRIMPKHQLLSSIHSERKSLSSARFGMSSERRDLNSDMDVIRLDSWMRLLFNLTPAHRLSTSSLISSIKDIKRVRWSCHYYKLPLSNIMILADRLITQRWDRKSTEKFKYLILNQSIQLKFTLPQKPLSFLVNLLRTLTFLTSLTGQLNTVVGFLITLLIRLSRLWLSILLVVTTLMRKSKNMIRSISLESNWTLSLRFETCKISLIGRLYHESKKSKSLFTTSSMMSRTRSWRKSTPSRAQSNWYFITSGSKRVLILRTKPLKTSFERIKSFLFQKHFSINLYFWTLRWSIFLVFTNLSNSIH